MGDGSFESCRSACESRESFDREMSGVGEGWLCVVKSSFECGESSLESRIRRSCEKEEISASDDTLEGSG